MEMEIKNIKKELYSKIMLAFEGTIESLYYYNKGHIEAAKEELLFVLDETEKTIQQLEHYIKELQEYQKYLEASKGSIVEAIEAGYLDRKNLEEIMKNYQKLYEKIRNSVES
jgi:GTPase involved in cell partitioning and DNA repair